MWEEEKDRKQRKKTYIEPLPPFSFPLLSGMIMNNTRIHPLVPSSTSTCLLNTVTTIHPVCLPIWQKEGGWQNTRREVGRKGFLQARTENGMGGQAGVQTAQNRQEFSAAIMPCCLPSHHKQEKSMLYIWGPIRKMRQKHPPTIYQNFWGNAMFKKIITQKQSVAMLGTRAVCSRVNATETNVQQKKKA